MNNSVKLFRTALTCFLIMTILCGVVYTVAVTGIAQLIFPSKANGSIITVTLADGTIREYGSELMAQEFTKANYLIGRPMGVTNLSAVSEEQKELVTERINWMHLIDPNNTAEIPIDLVTASGSGLDPNITPEAAMYQVPRLARERNISEEEVEAIIQQYTTERFLGFWGEPAVNVLKVNLALDGLL